MSHRDPTHSELQDPRCDLGHARLPPPPDQSSDFVEVILPRTHSAPDLNLSHFEVAYDSLQPGPIRQLTRRRWLDSLEGPEFPAPPSSIVGRCREALSEMEPWQRAEAIKSLWKSQRQHYPEYPLLGGDWLARSLTLSDPQSGSRTIAIAQSLLDTGFLRDVEVADVLRSIRSNLLNNLREPSPTATVVGACAAASAAAICLPPLQAATLTATALGLGALYRVRLKRVRAIVDGYLREVENTHTTMRAGAGSSLDEMLTSLKLDTPDQRTATEAFLLTRTLRIFGVSSVTIHTALARSSSVTHARAPIVKLLHTTLKKEGITRPDTLHAAYQRSHDLRPRIEQLHNALFTWTSQHRDAFRSRLCDIILDLRYNGRHTNTPRPRLAWIDGNLTWLEPHNREQKASPRP